MCIFGGGWDIAVYEGAHNRKDSYSSPGFTYQVPDGIKYNTE